MIAGNGVNTSDGLVREDVSKNEIEIFNLQSSDKKKP